MTSGRVELADRVFAFLPQQPGSSNAGFVAGTRDTAVIDTRMAAHLAQELADAVAAVTDVPVRYVVNTHFHGDHVFGNQVFAPAARFISHRLAREELVELGEAHIHEFLEHYDIVNRYPRRVVDDILATRLHPADLTFETELVLRLGGADLRLRHLGPAHTKGDVVAFLPEERVLFTGDLVFNEIHPYWIDGYLDGTISALRELTRWDVRTVVPGHGPVTDRTAIERMLGYFERIRDVVLAAKRSGDDMSAAVDVLGRELGDYGAQPHRLASTVERFWPQADALRPEGPARALPDGAAGDSR